MLVSEIIQRVRNDLDDNRSVSYSTLNLIDRIRIELNDTAGNAIPIDVLSEARKILGDESTRTGVPVSLASIRAELNDRANTTAGVSVTVDGIRAKLGDVPDSVLGVTTVASVNADSVIHYAQWGNTGGVAGTTGNVNASVQLAASSNSISSYAADGIKTIKGMRPDALINGQLSGGFQAALNLYVLARCVEGEVETGTNAYGVFYDRFVAAVAAVPSHIQDSVITHYIHMGENAIAGRRPDIGLCAETSSLLEDFVMAQLSQSKLGDNTKYQANLANFYNELDKIPYHYTDSELNQYITDGQNAIKELRPDAASMILCFSDAVKSYAVCHALGRRFGKAAETMTLWQAHNANFKDSAMAVPPHWTDAELNAFSEDGGKVIFVRRPDLSGTAAESIEKMHYTVFAALERRIGTDANAAAMHKVHFDQFYNDLENLPYHWTDEELAEFQNEAIQTISSIRDDLTDGMQIRSDLVPAVLFCVSSLANNSRKDPGSRNLSDTQWTKLVSLIKEIPYHWTDEELMNQFHDAMRDILAKRSDARMDDDGYELAGVETEPLITDEFPLRESFAKASEWFSAAEAIASRIGQDQGAETKYQLWQGKYQHEIGKFENRSIHIDGKLCMGDEVRFSSTGTENTQIAIRSGSVNYIQSGIFDDEFSIRLDSPPLQRLFKYVSETGSRYFILDVMQNGEILFAERIRIFNKRKDLSTPENTISETGGIKDCPDDGNTYLRKYGQWVATTGSITVNLIGTNNAEWYIDGGASHQSGETVQVEPGTYTISFKAVDGAITPASKNVTIHLGDSVSLVGDYQALIYYGYIQDGSVYSVSQITSAMIERETVSTASAAATQISINAPAGSVIFIMIPAASGLTAKKDDGVGGKTAFNLDNGAAGTGANGAETTYNGMNYLISGEFNLVNAETIVYVE